LIIIFRIICLLFVQEFYFVSKFTVIVEFLFISFSPSILLGKYSNFAYIKIGLYYFGMKF
jgi:hypothetical protein